MTDHNHSIQFFSSQSQPLLGLRGKSGFIICPVLLSLLLIFNGCNETFEPWQENDQYHFSIYGVLDATTDTQWVRVMPVREEFFLEPVPIDATVTLEHIESGETVVMNDSLFAFAHNSYAYNFWTTMDLQPEQSYQLKVEDSNGSFSRAGVILPKDFPVPLVRMGLVTDENEIYNIVYIEGVEQLADVQVIYHGRYPNTGEGRVLGLPYLEDTLRIASGDLQVFISPGKHNDKLVGFPPVTKSLVFVAAAGPDYFPFGSVSERVISLPEGVSNIENGVGYLGGIVSKPVPYKSCFEEFTLVPCPVDPNPW